MHTSTLVGVEASVAPPLSRALGAISEGVPPSFAQLRALEEQVRQLQKMEIMGQFAGAIAHDFNNILAVILGSGKMLLESLPPVDARRPEAEAIVDASERGAALTRQLLAFSRRQPFDQRVIDLRALVDGAEGMLRRIVGEDIEVTVNRGDGGCCIYADASQIEQVLLNLVANARDAMPGGGRLDVKTAQVELTNELEAVHGSIPPGSYVELSVTDTGCGMDVETQRRIFEPLFTTKPSGRGTGLGLSTCYGIVKRAGGYIRVASEVNCGAIFRVFLPVVDAAAAPPPPSTRPVERGPAIGTETILVVEDDAAVRQLVCRILERLGYRVLEAKDGRDAVTIADAHEGPIHLILADIMLPGLNGSGVAGRVRSRSPETKALFMSGHSGQTLRDNKLIDRECQRFIQKPFTPSVFATAVREVLDA